MARRTQMTPFARFLIFLLFFVPVAYIGASYYNGEDGIENFKNLIGLGDGDRQELQVEESVPVAADEVTLDLRERIEELERENRELRQQLEQAEQQLKENQVQ